jgi:MFS family permease
MQYISPYVVDVLGLKKGYWGFLLSIYFLMTSMGGYLNEKLAKRFDYRLLAIISTALLSLSVTFLALRNLVTVLILLVLVSIVYAMRASDIIAWENAIIGIEHRSTVLSTLSTIIKIMYIITPPIVGLLIDIASYGDMYLLIGLSSLLAVVFMVTAYTSKA